MNQKVLLTVAGALLFSLLAIQLVPYRVTHPPVTQEPEWDSPRTAELARKACFDCHSNEVRVPWYGHVAPASWLVTYHVNEARSFLNFSEMDKPQEEAHEAGEEAEEGHMPPGYYNTLHPEARLTDEERAALVAGLNATLGGEKGGHDEAGGDGDEDEDDHDDHDHDH